MRVHKALKIAAFLSITVFSLQAIAGTATPSSILVVPARARLVQLAFQVAAVQDVGLVCYDTSALSKDLLIHVWNGHEWIRITADEYASGAFMTGTARDVFILGPENMIPPQMASDPFWGKTTHRIAEMDTATVLNTLGKTMKFSSRQWKWLAEKNGLTLTDTNAERRRYGRWGKSGVDTSAIPKGPTLSPATPPASDVIIMPPAAPIVESAPSAEVVPPAAPAPAPVAPPVVAPPVVTPPPAPVVEAPAAPAAPVVDPTTK